MGDESFRYDFEAYGFLTSSIYDYKYTHTSVCLFLVVQEPVLVVKQLVFGFHLLNIHIFVL